MIRTPLFPRGTRVRIRRGRFPLDPDLVGRTGTVVEVDERRPERLGVVLDGEEEVRGFAEEELVDVEQGEEGEEGEEDVGARSAAGA